MCVGGWRARAQITTTPAGRSTVKCAAGRTGVCGETPNVPVRLGGYAAQKLEPIINSKSVMSMPKSLSHAPSDCLVPKFCINLAVTWKENAIARPVRIRGGNFQQQTSTRPSPRKPSGFLRRFLLVTGALSILVNHCFGQAPVIVTPPFGQEVSAGVGVVLSVQVTGSEPFMYEWMKNGLPLQGGNQPTVVFASASPMTSGSYSVRVNNGSGFATSQLARLQVDDLTAKIVPLALTGWNQDVVLEDSSAPLATADFDTLGAYWFEAGLGGHSDGLPASGHFTSQFNTNVLFQFQPYTANNVLRLQGPSQSIIAGTLTLVTPGPYRSLAILASSGGQDANRAALGLSFSDGTSVSNLNYVALDWGTGEPENVAISGLGRYQTLEAPANYQNPNRGFAMYETDINLAALGLEQKILTGLTFTKANDALVTGVFAVSGEPNTTPTLNLRLLPDKQTELTVSGFPQTSYRIDSSSDLVSWVPLVSVASSNGISLFTNAPGGQLSNRFYRVAVP